MEFAATAWAPWTVGDIDLLERVQKRAVSLISGLNGRTYEDKLQELGLSSLAERRIKYDLVQTYKILNGIDRVDQAIWFKQVGVTAHIRTRNTSCEGNLLSTISRTDIRKNFFSSRVVPVWNALPTELKETRSLNSLKKQLDDINLN